MNKVAIYSAQFCVSDSRYYVEGLGDGFGDYAGTLWPEMRFSTREDAEAGAKCSNEAYRQGYMAAQSDMRKALGIK